MLGEINNLMIKVGKAFSTKLLYRGNASGLIFNIFTRIWRRKLTDREGKPN